MSDKMLTSEETRTLLPNLLRALPQEENASSHGYMQVEGKIVCPSCIEAAMIAEFLRDVLRAHTTIGVNAWADKDTHYVGFDEPVEKRDEPMTSENATAMLELILKALPPEPRSYDTSDDPGFWARSGEILCPTEADADTVADLIEDMLRSNGSTIDVHTGYYDPFEDAEAGECDDFTGFWYIDFD